MSSKLRLMLLAISFLILNCNNTPKTPSFEYIYANENVISICQENTTNTQLLNEAVFTFENDLINFYDPINKSPNRAYTKFLSAIRNGSIDYTSIVSKHSVTVLNALKQDKSLWNLNDIISPINYKNPIVNCIAEHMKPAEFTTTFKALVHTNSLSFRMYDEELRRNTILASQDKYLGLFVALDLYYGKLYNIDFKTIKPVENTNKAH